MPGLIASLTGVGARAAADAFRTALVHLRRGPAWVCSGWSVPHVGLTVAALAGSPNQ